MKKWNLVIDLARCHDCNNCFMADKDEFVGNDWPPYSKAQPWSGQRWLNIERKECGQFPLARMAYLPLLCQHCDHAPCIDESAGGAVYKREDGLVIIDPEKAKGHPEIVDTCPYGVIYWNEEAELPQKCTGCAHLLDEGWKDTRCSQVCPTEALKLVLADDAEMRELVASEGLDRYLPELGTGPRVYFKNLHLWTKASIAGSVVFGDNDECAENVTVSVESNGTTVGKALTNDFGDFCIDGLEAGSYVVSLSATGYRPLAMTVTIEACSTTLTPLFLERSS